MSEETILVVDDNREIVYSISELLKYEGYQTVAAYDGMQALEVLEKEKIDLILLDVMMPRLNGLSALMKLREKSQIPVIILSAKTEESDKVSGLVLGADDYVVKPFSPMELVARVKAHIQIHRTLKTGKGEKIIQTGELSIYPDAYLVYKNDSPVALTSREFELLAFLAKNPNIVFSKERLFDQVWGLEAAGDASILTVYINKLRDKLEEDPSNPRWIKTVWGVGYRFQKSGR